MPEKIFLTAQWLSGPSQKRFRASARRYPEKLVTRNLASDRPSAASTKVHCPFRDELRPRPFRLLPRFSISSPGLSLIARRPHFPSRICRRSSQTRLLSCTLPSFLPRPTPPSSTNPPPHGHTNLVLLVGWRPRLLCRRPGRRKENRPQTPRHKDSPENSSSRHARLPCFRRPQRGCADPY